MGGAGAAPLSAIFLNEREETSHRILIKASAFPQARQADPWYDIPVKRNYPI